MMVFKRKQIVVLSLVLMIVVAGYLQYSYKKSSISVSGKDNSRLGEAVYVDSNDLNPTAQADKKDQKDNKDNTDTNKKDNKDNKDTKDTKNQKAVAASKEANDYFTQARLDKEITRSKDVDALKAISDDPAAAKEAKAKAYDQRMKIVQNSERELRVETLLKEKGFSEVLALFGEDGSLDIVVKAPNLTSAQTAQIADIVSRQASADLTKLHIKNKF